MRVLCLEACSVQRENLFIFYTFFNKFLIINIRVISVSFGLSIEVREVREEEEEDHWVPHIFTFGRPAHKTAEFIQ